MSKISNDFSHYLNPQIKKDKSKKTKNEEKKRVTSKEKSFDGLFFEEVQQGETIQPHEQEEKTIAAMLKQIGRQGEILKKSRLLTDLDKYKKMVKDYLGHVIHLMETSESKILWNKHKKEKISKVHLQIIDKELADLTKIFFQEQQNTLAIAAKIDRIEGLMINLLS